MWTGQLDVFRGIRQKGIKVYYIFKYDFLIKILVSGIKLCREYREIFCK